jgi:hypothetical protein
MQLELLFGVPDHCAEEGLAVRLSAFEGEQLERQFPFHA